MVDPLSGEQFELSAGDYRATIASVGASLRELTWQGRHLVVPFDAHEIRPDYRGAVLAPWPNRVVDGKYQFDGLEHQLALTEPERGHALHGLVVWQDFTGAHVYAEKCTASQEMVIESTLRGIYAGLGSRLARVSDIDNNQAGLTRIGQGLFDGVADRDLMTEPGDNLGQAQ